MRVNTSCVAEHHQQRSWECPTSANRHRKITNSRYSHALFMFTWCSSFASSMNVCKVTVSSEGQHHACENTCSTKQLRECPPIINDINIQHKITKSRHLHALCMCTWCSSYVSSMNVCKVTVSSEGQHIMWGRKPSTKELRVSNKCQSSSQYHQL